MDIRGSAVLTCEMPTARFPFDAQLVGVRREVCPGARWDRPRRVWTMSQAEAASFCCWPCQAGLLPEHGPDRDR